MSPPRRYGKDPQQLISKLEDLIERRDEFAGADLVFSMLESVFKLVRDGAGRGDLKMLHHALLELRYAMKVFAPYRSIRKVSIFGSARTKSDEPEYRLAEELANRVTRLGYMVITGAGPGIMEAAQDGAGRSKSFGVNIRLPFESEANEVIQTIRSSFTSSTSSRARSSSSRRPTRSSSSPAGLARTTRLSSL